MKSNNITFCHFILACLLWGACQKTVPPAAVAEYGYVDTVTSVILFPAVPEGPYPRIDSLIGTFNRLAFARQTPSEIPGVIVHAPVKSYDYNHYYGKLKVFYLPKVPLIDTAGIPFNGPGLYFLCNPVVKGQPLFEILDTVNHRIVHRIIANPNILDIHAYIDRMDELIYPTTREQTIALFNRMLFRSNVRPYSMVK